MEAGKLSDGRELSRDWRADGAQHRRLRGIRLLAPAILALAAPAQLSAETNLLWRRPVIQRAAQENSLAAANRGLRFAAEGNAAAKRQATIQADASASAIRVVEARPAPSSAMTAASETAASSRPSAANRPAQSSVAFARPIRDPNFQQAQFTQFEEPAAFPGEADQSAFPGEADDLRPDPLEGDFGFDDPPQYELAQNPDDRDTDDSEQSLADELRDPFVPFEQPADLSRGADPFADDPIEPQDPLFPPEEELDEPDPLLPPAEEPETPEESLEFEDTPEAQVPPGNFAQPPGLAPGRQPSIPPAGQPFPSTQLPPSTDPFPGFGPLAPERTPEERTQDFRDLCQEELAQLKASTLADVMLDITVRGTPDIDFPLECTIDDGSLFEPRSWAQITYLWKASALCHKPLYFEDAQLERYGHSWGPAVQPFVSGAHFFSRLPILPYCMGYTPPQECIYALGYYRPGSCAPYMIPAVPISARAALIQAGAATGTAIVIP